MGGSLGTTRKHTKHTKKPQFIKQPTPLLLTPLLTPPSIPPSIPPSLPPSTPPPPYDTTIRYPVKVPYNVETDIVIDRKGYKFRSLIYTGGTGGTNNSININLVVVNSNTIRVRITKNANDGHVTDGPTNAVITLKPTI